MKTALSSPASESLSSSSPEPALAGSPAPASSLDATERAAAPSANSGPPQGVGRPTAMNARMLDTLCAVIRETGASDSAAAARVGVHPSTVSRWKRDFPDVAILLRAAREEFRSAMLAVILAEAAAGHARSWRAAAWLLERVFPEDYALRASERAKFREQYDAVCASEAEGSEVALPDEGEALQNVQNATAPAPRRAAGTAALPGTPLQNVQNSASGVTSGSVWTPSETEFQAGPAFPRGKGGLRK
jgi:hypothetical protein